jgi:hypothetical protein
MKTWYVEWRIEVDAETPEEAARIAQSMQRDPNSGATVFHVATDKGFEVIDLES